MERTWLEAIKRVLKEAQAPLHYGEISERVLGNGYYKTEGATPAATVNAQLASSVKHDPESPFVRVGKGIFALKAGLPDVSSIPQAKPAIDANTLTEAEVEDSDSIIRCFGMYWDRERVVWRRDPKMLGKQQAQAKSVDFSKQRGIYILYDHHTVVYVGRSIDRPLGLRLYEHTIDRLGGRWNRFSWFGLLDVTEDGQLREVPLANGLAAVIGTLEALLIEALEPPQNRKRGDDLAAVEYIQDVDPESREREIQNTLRAIEQKMRSA